MQKLSMELNVLNFDASKAFSATFFEYLLSIQLNLTSLLLFGHLGSFHILLYEHY